MNPNLSPYSFDTSALIDGLERYYPQETFPALWENVDELIQARRLLISEEVWEEACHCDAAVRDWATPRRDAIVVPTDEVITTHVSRIGQRYPTWTVDGRNQADPFVVAVGLAHGAIVVTGERSNAGSDAKPKIPYACREFGVRSLSFLDFVRNEGWVFG